MPKRVIDFDAMWGSDKIASCAEWAQAEYAWLYGLADPSGCFELTNLRVIWGRVAAIRRNLSIERLEQVFAEFRDKGLLFVWEQDGKVYAHWTGSDVPGRLPPPSWRMRLERLAPPVPKRQLAEYVSRFGRGRAASPGGKFLADERAGEENLTFDISNLKRRQDEENLFCEGSDLKDARRNESPASGNSGLKDVRSNEIPAVGSLDLKVKCAAAAAGAGSRGSAGGVSVAGSRGAARLEGLKDRVEEDQAQDLDLNLDLCLEPEGNGELEAGRMGVAGSHCGAGEYSNLNLHSNSNSNLNVQSKSNSSFNSNVQLKSNSSSLSGLNQNRNSNSDANANANAPLGSNQKSKANSESEPGGETETNGSPYLDLNANSHRGASGTGALSAAATRVYRDKWDQAARELRVGQGPVCGPVRVKPEAIERIRLRNAGMRSP